MENIRLKATLNATPEELEEFKEELNKMGKKPMILPADAKISFAGHRRHNYRTDNLPPQGTDKHIDELK